MKMMLLWTVLVVVSLSYIAAREARILKGFFLVVVSLCVLRLWICNMGSMMRRARGAGRATEGSTGREHAGRHRRTVGRHDRAGQHRDRHGVRGDTGSVLALPREREAEEATKENRRARGDKGIHSKTMGTRGKLMEREGAAGAAGAGANGGEPANAEDPPTLSGQGATRERREGMRERKEGIPAASRARGNSGREERGGAGCRRDTL